MDIKHAYAELGLERPADEATVKAAWRRLASQWHPDRNPSQQAVLRMQRINHAFEQIRAAGFAAPADGDPSGRRRQPAPPGASGSGASGASGASGPSRASSPSGANGSASRRSGPRDQGGAPSGDAGPEARHATGTANAAAAAPPTACSAS